MEKVTLNAELRESTGKGACKKMRRENLVPCIVYSKGKEGINLQVDKKDLWTALHTEAGENAIIDIKIPEKKSNKTVIVQEVQLDPVNDMFLHVDFHAISMTDKLKVKVPITLKGEAVGVKEDSGVLSQAIWEIELECLPTAIPEHIEINVDELRIGDSLHVKDIIVEADVVVHADPGQVLVSVIPPKTEESEEEASEEGEEPEVIKKGKKEEEGEEEPEAEAPSGEEG